MGCVVCKEDAATNACETGKTRQQRSRLTPPGRCQPAQEHMSEPWQRARDRVSCRDPDDSH